MDEHEWDARYAASELVWSGEPNRFVEAEVADLVPGQALDLGCGEGRNAIWLADRGWRVRAVDFSSVALTKARRLADRRGVIVTWVHGDVVREAHGDGDCDLVLLAYLQVAESARRTALRHAAAALAPGGTLLVVAHDRTNLESGWGGPRDPAVLYGPADVVADLPELHVVKAERVERVVDQPDGPRTAIDLLVRAVRP